jgi:hypothetical protein
MMGPIVRFCCRFSHCRPVPGPSASAPFMVQPGFGAVEGSINKQFRLLIGARMILD